VPQSRVVAAPKATQQAGASASVRVSSGGGIKIRNVRSRGSSRPGQPRPVQIPRLKIPSRGPPGGQRQILTMREQALEASKTARAYRAKPVSKSTQQPASARAAYGHIGVEQLIAPQGGPMAPRPGYVPKPQAPAGASRRPQPFAGHGGRRVADPSSKGNASEEVREVEGDDGPPTRGSSRAARRGDGQPTGGES
jgi:hypothetical protein